jgi:hypothetical protein
MDQSDLEFLKVLSSESRQFVLQNEDKMRNLKIIFIEGLEVEKNIIIELTSNVYTGEILYLSF